MTRRDVLIRNIPERDIARADALRGAWPHDISRSEALRVAIERGLDASPEIDASPRWWDCYYVDTCGQPGVSIDEFVKMPGDPYLLREDRVSVWINEPGARGSWMAVRYCKRCEEPWEQCRCEPMNAGIPA